MLSAKNESATPRWAGLLSCNITDAKGIKTAFLLCCVASLLARGQTVFQPLYAIDTYMFMHGETVSSIYQTFLSQGRFGLAAIFWIREKIGYLGMDVAVSSAAFSIVLFSATAILLAYTIFPAPRFSTVVVFSLLVTLHPFGTEFFHFSEATFAIALAFFCGSAGLFLALRSSSSLLQIGVSTLLLVASLSIYQSAISCVISAWIMAVVARIHASPRPQFRVLKRSLSVSLAVIVASLVSYVVLLRLLKFTFGVASDARMDLSALTTSSGILLKLDSLANALGKFFSPSAGLVSTFASILLLLLVAAALVTFGAQTAARRGVWTGLTVILLSCCAIVAAIFPQLAGQIVWLVPRIIWPAIVPTAAIIAMGWGCLPVQRLTTSVVSVVLVLLSIVYIGSSNRILFDQRRLNLFDANEANRIVARLELRADFKTVKHLAVVGGSWGRTTALPTTSGDMNVSALSVAWAKLGLFQEATGYHFSEPTSNQAQIAATYCTSANPWPAENSITIVDALAIVCLPKPG